ncbi:MAG: hypothetical protein PHN56_03015 [Candidatus Nanoarchaeia archaeon]|nr:hypothetical protein [Candidatus Nanoarchaeia archaeon]
MNIKLIAFSLMLVVLLAGCTSIIKQNQESEVSTVDSGNQTIDDLLNDYSDNITDIDLGEMI